MSLIPCWRYRTGYCRVDSLDCQPWKSLKIVISVVGEFCQLEFEHTFLCEIITYCDVVFGSYEICLELGGPSALGGPLDFVHPCPMVVTPLTVISTVSTNRKMFDSCNRSRQPVTVTSREHGHLDDAFVLSTCLSDWSSRLVKWADASCKGHIIT